MRFDHSGLRWMIALLLFAATLLPLGLWRLGSTDIVTMEGIVSDGSRFMADTGQYMVPRLHSEIYSYKPPLAYWLALVSTEWIGVETETTLRLPFVLSGILMALVVLLVIGSRLGPWTGLICSLASATGVLVIQKLRIAEFDMPLAAGVGIAITLAIAELTATTPRAWRWQAAYLGLVLAFLAKGIPALMFFGPGLLIAAWWTSSWKRLFTPAHIAGGLTFCLGVGLWALGAWMGDGWAPFEQPLAEADAKGLTWDAEALGATLLKPLVVAGCFFPWTLVLPMAFGRKNWFSEDSDAQAIAEAAAGFVLGGLLTFMLVPATETRYLLPLAAPLGILCGLLLQMESKGVARTVKYGAIAIGLLLAVSAFSLDAAGLTVPPTSHSALLVVFGAGLFALGIGLDRLRMVGRGRAAVVLLMALGLGLFQMLVVDPHRASSRSLRWVAESFEAHMDSEEVWVGPVSAGFHHSSLFFYLRRPVKTFVGSELPPVGADVILFSDEPPGLKAAPFDYSVIEQRENRGIEFTLVRVDRHPENSPGSDSGNPSSSSWPAAE